MAESLLMRIELTKGCATEYTISECWNLVLFPLIDNKLQTSLVGSVVFSNWDVASIILEWGRVACMWPCRHGLSEEGGMV